MAQGRTHDEQNNRKILREGYGSGTVYFESGNNLQPVA